MKTIIIYHRSEHFLLLIALHLCPVDLQNSSKHVFFCQLSDAGVSQLLYSNTSLCFQRLVLTITTLEKKADYVSTRCFMTFV